MKNFSRPQNWDITDILKKKVYQHHCTILVWEVACLMLSVLHKFLAFTTTVIKLKKKNYSDKIKTKNRGESFKAFLRCTWLLSYHGERWIYAQTF